MRFSPGCECCGAPGVPTLCCNSLTPPVDMPETLYATRLDGQCTSPFIIPDDIVLVAFYGGGSVILGWDAGAPFGADPNLRWTFTIVCFTTIWSISLNIQCPPYSEIHATSRTVAEFCVRPVNFTADMTGKTTGGGGPDCGASPYFITCPEPPTTTFKFQITE